MTVLFHLAFAIPLYFIFMEERPGFIELKRKHHQAELGDIQ